MNEVFIIAEAGVNHNGSVELARKLIDAAADAGVDAVKFQTFKSEKLVSKAVAMAKYQAENTNSSETQLEMIKKLELSYDEFSQLREYCDLVGIKFMTTPDEEESSDFIYNLVDIYKIGSGEITNLPYLKHIAAKSKPIILSTGMSTIAEVSKAVDAIRSVHTKIESKFPPLTLLHCTTDYPVAFDDVNLRSMLTLKNTFHLPVGYSDHTMGIEVALGAAAIGASVIEKHFTLDRKMDGPDHKASLEPGELKAMVSAIRNLEKAMGDGVKRPTDDELAMRHLVRKSLVTLHDIKAGTQLRPEMFIMKRPGDGVQPEDLQKICGMILLNDISGDETLTWDHLRKPYGHK